MGVKGALGELRSFVGMARSLPSCGRICSYAIGLLFARAAAPEPDNQIWCSGILGSKMSLRGFYLAAGVTGGAQLMVNECVYGRRGGEGCVT